MMSGDVERMQSLCGHSYSKCELIAGGSCCFQDVCENLLLVNHTMPIFAVDTELLAACTCLVMYLFGQQARCRVSDM